MAPWLDHTGQLNDLKAHCFVYNYELPLNFSLVSWVDPNGVLRLYDYISDHLGYRIDRTRLFKVKQPKATQSEPIRILIIPECNFQVGKSSAQPYHIPSRGAGNFDIGGYRYHATIQYHFPSILVFPSTAIRIWDRSPGLWFGSKLWRHRGRTT